jgi:hypothetical protein
LQPYDPNAGQETDGEEVVMPVEERKAQNLSIKIRNAIPMIMQNCCDPKFVEKYKHPKWCEKRSLYFVAPGKYW